MIAKRVTSKVNIASLRDPLTVSHVHRDGEMPALVTSASDFADRLGADSKTK